MLSTKLSSKMQAALAMVALMLFVTNSWADAHEAVLHNFSDALTGARRRRQWQGDDL